MAMAMAMSLPSLLLIVLLIEKWHPCQAFLFIGAARPSTKAATSLYYNNKKEDDYYDSSNCGGNNTVFKDETPKQRQARMKLVHQIQESFYQQESRSAATTILLKDHDDDDTEDDLVIANLPILKVATHVVDLPGYQRILEVYDPCETHMFRNIFSGPQPWRFGMLSGQQLEETFTKIGTIMQISDVIEDEDFGGFGLIVQAVERFEIVGDGMVQRVPYPIANVKILLDEEEEEDQNESDGTENYITSFESLTECEFLPRKWSDLDESGNFCVPPIADYNYDLLAKKRRYVAGTGETELDPFLAELEYRIWVEIDAFYYLLAKNYNVNANLLSQLLALLPEKLPAGILDWPKGFQFDGDQSAQDYPPLRRVRRFSFVVWSLLKSATQILDDSTDHGHFPTRQEILETTSIAERLGLAYHTLSDINQRLSSRKR